MSSHQKSKKHRAGGSRKPNSRRPATGKHYSPGGTSRSYMHPGMMMPPPMMEMSFPPMMSMGPMMHPGTPMGGAFATISEGTTAAATAHNQAASSNGFHTSEDETKKYKAKIELLEKKIRAKDQLFDDALASTMAGSGASGVSGVEYKNLTSELKKRVLEYKTKYTEAESEIERLTKTVKVVEVEVKEDSEPLHNAI